MSQYYYLTEAKKFRDPWTTAHGTFQTFFAKFEGVSQSVMVNKKEGSDPTTGNIYGTMEVVPGKEYLKFKSEKAPEGVTPPPVQKDMSQPENVPQGPSQLDRIEKKLDQLLERKGHQIVADADEPIDVSAIPF